MDLMRNGEQSPLTFLNLPPEIRMQIYQEAIFDTASRWAIHRKWGYRLASTSHQILLEVLPVILRDRPLHTKSFQKMLKWTKDGKPQHMGLIRKLGLSSSLDCYTALEKCPRDLYNLQELVPSSGFLLESTPTKLHIEQAKAPLQSQQSEPIPESEASSSIIALFWNALLCFSSVETLHISLADVHEFGSGIQSSRFQPQNELILEMTSIVLPNIMSYTVTPDMHPLSHLRRFHNLRHLSFNGSLPLHHKR